MSVYHPHFTAQIQGAGETIFDLIANMPNYGRWRKRSAGERRYRHIRSVSAQPISTRDHRARGRALSRRMTGRIPSPFITPCC
jgi:hypothetical protein